MGVLNAVGKFSDSVDTQPHTIIVNNQYHKGLSDTGANLHTRTEQTHDAKV
jgi:hypothetical protein